MGAPVDAPRSRAISALFDREENRRQPPYGNALDLGCGSGMWSVALARRGWHVTGVDMVPKALRAAGQRARQAGVGARFLEGDATALRATGVGSGFRLMLDFGTVASAAATALTSRPTASAAPASSRAPLLMYAAAPGRRGPLPRGASRDEIEAAYPKWRG